MYLRDGDFIQSYNNSKTRKLVYFFNKYLLSVCYVPGIDLGPGNIVVSKADTFSYLSNFNIEKERKVLTKKIAMHKYDEKLRGKLNEYNRL